MAQCQALTKSGEQCKRDALPDSPFCSVHQGYDGPLASAEAEPTVDQVTEQPPTDTRKLRYLGRGSYVLPPCGITFSRSNPVHDVPLWAYESLIKLPYFEEA